MQDATSGPNSCSAAAYSGPDSAAASVTGTCTDIAGNPTTPSITVKFDDTAPNVTTTLDPAANGNGWHRTQVTFTVNAVNDATSGLPSSGACSPPATYSGPDAAAKQLTGSCTDVAGNSADRQVTVKYDATPPTVNAALERPADHNGWFNKAVKLNLTGLQDATSGPNSCSAPSYSGPDSATAAITGSCSDLAGNTTTPSITAKYDDTPPTVTGALARAPGASGWYTQPVQLELTSSDATSGIDAGSCNEPTYSGPDAGSAQVTGGCSDNAGNSATGSATLKYDATAPAVSAAFERAADANGWYNHPVKVTIDGSDATSGLDTCTQPPTYDGPDAGSAQVGGSCRDKAGNATPGNVVVRYDSTPPTVNAGLDRPPDGSGWYNHAVSLELNGADATSGIGSCIQAGYQGPDTGDTSLGGSCVDRAGNPSGPSSFAFKYDSTPPQISASLDRGPDANGWFNHSVKLTASGGDALSGLASCSSPSYSGPDDSSAALTATCSDAAGNMASSTADVRYDGSGPSMNAALSRDPDAHGWFNHAVQLTTSGSDGVSGLASCSSPSYGGPDDRGASLTGTCTDVAGNGASRTTTFRYDSTPPTLTAELARKADANGWYNSPVKLAAIGADATSGVDACSSPTYGGPDDPTASLTAACSDLAGNATSRTVVLRYDSTPPRLTGLTVASRNHSLVVSWTASGDAASVVLARSRDRKGSRETSVYRGTGRSFADRGVDNGVRYRYRVAAADVAGNVASLVAVGVPRALRTPAEGQRVKGAPTLTWWGVPQADYYNVQLYHGRLKVLSLWPVLEKLVLKRAWRYEGRSFRLVPGVYRWYVFPGFGDRKASRYGKLLGGSTFRVVR